MIPAVSYEEIEDHINYTFSSTAAEGKSVRMVGILFGRPGSPLAKAEVLPNLEYFDRRSGSNIDFYAAGFRQGFPGLVVDDHVSRKSKDTEFFGPDHGWIFSATKFNELREDIQKRTSWKYSGGVDLVLLNARRNVETGKAAIELRSAVCLNLDQAKNDGLMLTVEMLFERIFQYAESQSGDDPTWGFSDTAGVRVAGTSLRRLLLRLLPKEAGKDIERIAHLAVKDIGV